MESFNFYEKSQHCDRSVFAEEIFFPLTCKQNYFVVVVVAVVFFFLKFNLYKDSNRIVGFLAIFSLLIMCSRMCLPLFPLIQHLLRVAMSFSQSVSSCMIE